MPKSNHTITILRMNEHLGLIRPQRLTTLIIPWAQVQP